MERKKLNAGAFRCERVINEFELQMDRSGNLRHLMKMENIKRINQSIDQECLSCPHIRVSEEGEIMDVRTLSTHVRTTAYCRAAICPSEMATSIWNSMPTDAAFDPRGTFAMHMYGDFSATACIDPDWSKFKNAIAQSNEELKPKPEPKPKTPMEKNKNYATW